MSHRRPKISFSVAIAAVLIASSVSVKAQSRTARDSLRGLTTVPVKVQITKGAGTTPDRLLEFVELRLRRSGIAVPEDNSPALRQLIPSKSLRQ